MDDLPIPKRPEADPPRPTHDRALSRDARESALSVELGEELNTPQNGALTKECAEKRQEHNTEASARTAKSRNTLPKQGIAALDTFGCGGRI